MVYRTLEDVAGKVEWEGGLFDAAYGYGLHHDDIDPNALPELYEAWKAMDHAHDQHFLPAYERVEKLLYPEGS